MLCEDFFEYRNLFDFSEYKSICFDSTNDKVIGKMNDEFKSIQFIGLKAKMYCIFTENAEEANTAKGANISIEFKEY